MTRGKSLKRSKAKRYFDPEVDDDHWQRLFEQHFHDMQSLDAISTIWISGFSKMGIDNSRRPRAEDLTNAIAPYTGYVFVQTDDHLILDQRDWYDMIANYKMPLTNFVRTPSELTYCDEPDIWHDVMGHIPFLAQKEYSDMYQLLAATYIDAYDAHRADLILELDFVGGMLIELGLIRESHGLKALGATLYSSSEIFQAFKPENQIVFSEEALKSGASYNRHSFQGKYYIIDSIDQLSDVILDIQNRL